MHPIPTQMKDDVCAHGVGREHDKRLLAVLHRFKEYGITISRPKSVKSRLNPDQNTSLAAPGALAHRLQRRTACKIQNGRQGAPKWQRGSGKVSTPRFLGVLSNFR